MAPSRRTRPAPTAPVPADPVAVAADADPIEAYRFKLCQEYNQGDLSREEFDAELAELVGRAPDPADPVA